MLTNLLLQLGVALVKNYIKSTQTKNDDKVLDLAKIGVEYLAHKTNNNVAKKVSSELNNSTMRIIQGKRF